MSPLTFALGNYGLTKPIKRAGTDFGRLDLKFVHVDQIVPMMRRMCRGLEFDICEMAFTTYVCARAAGLPFTAIPLFVTRNFHHWAIFYNEKSGIRTPKDLEGRKVGVNRGYTVTTGLWARGILQSEYGVDLNKVTWVCNDDGHLAEFKDPPNVERTPPDAKKVDQMLLDGEIDGAILGADIVDDPRVTHLIPNPKDAARAWHEKYRTIPINHLFCVDKDLADTRPDVTAEIFRMLKETKAAMPPSSEGIDFFPFGVEALRKPLELVMQYSVEQKIIPRAFAIEELFDATARALA